MILSSKIPQGRPGIQEAHNDLFSYLKEHKIEVEDYAKIIYTDDVTSFEKMFLQPPPVKETDVRYFMAVLAHTAVLESLRIASFLLSNQSIKQARDNK